MPPSESKSIGTPRSFPLLEPLVLLGSLSGSYQQQMTSERVDETREEEQERQSSEETGGVDSSPTSRLDHDHRLEFIIRISELRAAHFQTSKLLNEMALTHDLVEVALHNILYIRQIYPIELFERRRKFGIPVFQCVDKPINEYISEVIRAVGEELAQDTVSRVTVSVHRSETPLEKFIFSFESSKATGCGDRDDAELPLGMLQREMRSMLIKLNAIDAQLLPLDASDDLSFSVVMQLREGDGFVISEDDLEFDASDKVIEEKREEGRKSEAHLLRDPSLVHLIKAGPFSVSLHVQESEEKVIFKGIKGG